MASVSKRKWTYKGSEKEAWIVRWSEPNGSRGQKTFKMKKEADKYKLKVETEIENGTHASRGAHITVAEVLNLYVAHMETRQRDGKIGATHCRQIAATVKAHFIPILGRRKWNELTWQDLEDWCNRMAAQTRCSPTTRRAYLAMIYQAERFALKRDLTKRRTVSEFLSDMGGAKSKPIKTFSAADIGQLIQAAKARSRHGRDRSQAMVECAVHLAAFCGLRLGEILGLTVSNVNLSTRVLRVRHSMTLLGELKGPKTEAGNRDIPIPPHISDLLGAWMATHYTANERNLVFKATNVETKSHHNNFRSYGWSPLLMRAGLWQEDGDQMHFHALRHFAASWMIENGLALTDVAKLLGHSKFDMTLQVYAHPVENDDHRRNAVDRMAAALMVAGGHVPVLEGPEESRPEAIPLTRATLRRAARGKAAEDGRSKSVT